MVKADLTRDYYADLDLPPGADTATIKKQFKKLALTYHPDRNPGRETEVTAKFQEIQSAHEVLTDPQERAKYDANRLRSSTKYAGSSGVRGNPWSDIGSQYPPPPKAPTARRPAHQQQASAGAERYKNWEAPKQSAYQAAHEGAGARQKTYEAWESMKTKSQPSGQQSQQSSYGASSKTSKPPQVPPRGPPPPNQEKSFSGRAQQSSTPKHPFAAYHDYVRPDSRPSSPPKRSHSTNASNRKGFMPNTPGGDEPAGPKGAYFTERNKPAVAPELPSRGSPQRPHQSMNPESAQDSTTGMGDRPPAPKMRFSTPYSTHGGEKFNPFEASPVNRARSTREPSQPFTTDGQIPRTGSDPSMTSPHRSQSFASRAASKSKHQTKPSVETESDTTDGSESMGASFGKPRQRVKETNSASAANGTSQTPDTPLGPEHYRSRLSHLRQWYKEHPNTEPPLDGFPSDGPPLRSYQSNNDLNSEPSMYANTPSLKSGIKPSTANRTGLLTVSEVVSPFKETMLPTSNSFVSPLPAKVPRFVPDPEPARNPSGIAGERASLTAFEGMQRSMIDQLLHNKRQADKPSAVRSAQMPEVHGSSQSQEPKNAKPYSGKSFTDYRESAEAGSPVNKPKSHQSQSSSSSDTSPPLHFWKASEKVRASTNTTNVDRFSFNVNEETFRSSTPTRPTTTFSNSAENISTKFSEGDWTGKFEGSDYFKPVPKSSAPPSRAQSGSRSRGRSPTKSTVDPRFSQHRGSESEPVAESPSGTKFSAKEWADTFKPQTFAPPPPRQVPARKRTGPTIRTTMGGSATVVDEEENAAGMPLFNGRKTTVTPTISSPDAMDVDLPPSKNTVPEFKPNNVSNVKAMQSPKRAAAPSQSPTDEAALKVNFDDLKIQDLLSSLEMPRPPLPPALPDNLPGTRPSAAAYEDYQVRFAKYMTAWDLYNNQFMLHLVARKNQNDTLGTKRWLSDEGLEIYRRGLKEDGMVLSRWAAEKERHESVVRDWLVLREQVKEGAARESAARPKKKAH